MIELDNKGNGNNLGPRIFADIRFPKSNHLKEVVIPIPFPGTYDTLRQLACKGACVSSGCFCEECHATGSFVFTSKTVFRGSVIPLTGNEISHHILRIPLARCSKCGRWARVLPQELFPRKTFGVRVIEKSLRNYLFSLRGLRKAVTDIVLPAEHGPSHSTLSR